jgi:hypothetical protein
MQGFILRYSCEKNKISSIINRVEPIQKADACQFAEDCEKGD